MNLTRIYRLILALALGASMLATTQFGCATSSALRLTTAPPAPPPPEEPLPIPVLELTGDPQHIGHVHGETLSGQIHVLEEKFLDVRLGSPSKKMIAYAAASMFEAQIAPEHREEISALADGSGTDRREALLAQCFLDLTSSIACSTVALPASAGPDHVARLARNLDFPSLDIADKMSVVLVYRPAGKFQFVAVSWPALVGVLSGMNEHGLTLANMEIARKPRFPTAMPYTLLYRTILERCRNVDEAIDLLQKTPRQSTNNLMLMDAAGNRAVIEITPEAITVRRGTADQALISTNHQRGADTDSPGRCWRYDLLRASSGAGLRQTGCRAPRVNARGSEQGKWTIQSMVFEPSRRVMYLATGTKAADQKFYRVDLNRYFTRH